MNIEEIKQQQLFDELSSAYDAHYSDSWSQQYRRMFFNSHLVKGINLKNKKILDGLCGGGQTTQFLLSLGASVVGLDLSNNLVRAFKQRFPNTPVVCESILNTKFENESFDCVVVVGGLHHLHPYVDQAMDEIYRVLKKGGHFCFIEPHSGSVMDIVRRVWYKADSAFEKNEEAIHFAELEAKNRQRFEFLSSKYGGFFAYLLVLNSMIFRMPLWAKRLYSPILLQIERLIDMIYGGRILSCYRICQWRKKIVCVR